MEDLYSYLQELAQRCNGAVHLPKTGTIFSTNRLVNDGITVGKVCGVNNRFTHVRLPLDWKVSVSTDSRIVITDGYNCERYEFIDQPGPPQHSCVLLPIGSPANP